MVCTEPFATSQLSRLPTTTSPVDNTIRRQHNMMGGRKNSSKSRFLHHVKARMVEFPILHSLLYWGLCHSFPGLVSHGGWFLLPWLPYISMVLVSISVTSSSVCPAVMFSPLCCALSQTWHELLEKVALKGSLDAMWMGRYAFLQVPPTSAPLFFFRPQMPFWPQIHTGSLCVCVCGGSLTIENCQIAIALLSAATKY